jgi:hypothetical protein
MPTHLYLVLCPPRMPPTDAVFSLPDMLPRRLEEVKAATLGIDCFLCGGCLISARALCLVCYLNGRTGYA